MLKILERHMRQAIDRYLLSDCQHAYTKGCSVETALPKLVSTPEYSLHHRQVSMVAFLDIEEAFNNIQSQTILNELKFKIFQCFAFNFKIKRLKKHTV